MAFHEDRDLDRKAEEMIDGASVERVLDALSRVCYEKSDHIRSSYQDMGLAREWMKAARVIERASASLPRVPGITSTYPNGGAR